MRWPIVFALLFLPSSTSFVVTPHRRYQRDTIFLSLDTNQSPNDEHISENSLSKQEILLQEVLGIQPETDLERQERLSLRKLKIEERQRQQLSSIFVAIFSFLVAAGNYFNHYTHPTTSISLLAEMQQKSDPMNVIGRNGKPTVVEFWASLIVNYYFSMDLLFLILISPSLNLQAPWCENCKASATTLYSVEAEYRNRVNFVHVDANQNDDTTWLVIDRFGVDAIPHLAMVDANGDVQTALIGPIPRSVLRSDLEVMIENSKLGVNGDGSSENRKELPYTMYDAFENSPEHRHIRF